VCFYSEDKFCGHAKMYLYLLLIPTIPLSLVRNYTGLAKYSVIGLICASIGCLLLLGYYLKVLITGAHSGDNDGAVYPLNIFSMSGMISFIGFPIG
jgi:hypothetical protein